MNRCLVLAVLLSSACGGRALHEGGSEWNDPWADHHELFTIDHFEWDILFVIDDSTSMSAVQDRLVDLASVFEALNGEGCSGGAHPWTEYTYRIAFTTTDNGNPWCSSIPEAGKLVSQPCFERLDDFVSGEVDVRNQACLDHCSLTNEDLERAPTLVEADPVPRVRPWIERIDGVSNLPDDTEVQDAAACLLPQGIAGCRFESPLESMRLALERAATPGDPSFGFLRDHANLLIVILTDSDDCSLAPGGEVIFDPEGEKAFWSNPDAESPTPAVCWNAGMECYSVSGEYWCEPENKDASGEHVDADAAVLHSVQHYRDFLKELQEDKQSHNAELYVVVAGGFFDRGHLRFAESSDSAWQEQYGGGPGCTAPPSAEQPAVAALPPARLDSVTGEFGYGVSICEAEINNLLELPFSKTCQGWAQPCYPNCVLDSDPETAMLDPECEVVMHVPGEDAQSLLECLRDPDGAYLIDPESNHYVIPDGEDFCVVMAVDTENLTPDYGDDLYPGCREDGRNLQPIVERRPGVWVHSGARFLASCTESTQPEIDCPET